MLLPQSRPPGLRSVLWSILGHLGLANNHIWMEPRIMHSQNTILVRGEPLGVWRNHIMQGTCWQPWRWLRRAALLSAVHPHASFALQQLT